MGVKREDLTGRVFKELTVLRELDERRSGKRMWECKCTCGNLAKASTGALNSGTCYRCLECALKATARSKITHGATVGKAATGKSTYLYRCWLNMKQRCLKPDNPGYVNYGGRGISICDRWLEFANFAADMGDPPPGGMLERRDNNGDYCPENCEWATRLEQNRNRRNVIEVEINGVTDTLWGWSDRSGLPKQILYVRYHRGDRGEDLLRPVNQRLKREC